MFADGGIRGIAEDVEQNRSAWVALRQFQKPLLTAFSDGDPITRGGYKAFQELPGAKRVKHVTIHGAGHFVQEDQPEAFALAIQRFIKGELTVDVHQTGWRGWCAKGMALVPIVVLVAGLWL